MMPEHRPPFTLLPDPREPLRRALVREVRAMFNDPAQGEAPVLPSDEALFARDTPIRMVHADVVGMMAGGMAALMLQMLHPHALQGVLDHSRFREDMSGRLRRTARFIATTTYGHRDEAARAIARVNAIHARVSGTLPDGTPYSATDPRVLAWVHVSEVSMFLAAHLALVRPAMPPPEQDEYVRQFATIARALGADPVPGSRAEVAAIMRTLRADLAVSEATHMVRRLILEGRSRGVARWVQPFLARTAISLLPPFARTMLRLEMPGLADWPARLITRSLGDTLRWAFAGERRVRVDQLARAQASGADRRSS